MAPNQPTTTVLETKVGGRSAAQRRRRITQTNSDFSIVLGMIASFVGSPDLQMPAACDTSVKELLQGLVAFAAVPLPTVPAKTAHPVHLDFVPHHESGNTEAQKSIVENVPKTEAPRRPGFPKLDFSGIPRMTVQMRKSTGYQRAFPLTKQDLIDQTATHWPSPRMSAVEREKIAKALENDTDKAGVWGPAKIRVPEPERVWTRCRPVNKRLLPRR